MKAAGIVCLLYSSWLLTTASSQNQTLTIVVLTEPGNEENDPYTTVGRIALSLINNSTAILENYQLEMVKATSGCDVGPPGSVAAALLLGEKNKESEMEPAVVGVIGPTCSAAAMHLGSLVGRKELSVLNIHSARSAQLESRSAFPNSFGIAGTSSLFLQSALLLIKMNNWSVVSILYDASLLYHTAALQEAAEDSADFTVKEYFVSSTFPYIPLTDIQSESRIVFLFMEDVLLVRQILCLAYHMGMVFPAYQLVIVTNPQSVLFTEVPTVFTFSTLSQREYTCSAVQISAAMAGHIFISTEIFSRDPLLDYSEVFYSNFFSLEELIKVSRENLRNDEIEGESLLTPQFAQLFDAFWSLALALHNSDLRPENLLFSPIGLSGQHKTIRRELYKLNFRGFSGPIHFSNSTGSVRRKVYAYQNSEGSNFTHLLTFSHQESVTHQLLEQGRFLPSNIRVRNVVASRQVVPRVFTAIAFVTGAIAPVLLVFLHISMVIYRREASVKAGSHKILHLAYTGCYLLVLCIFVHTYLEGLVEDYNAALPPCILWHAVNSLLSVGFTMIVSTICVRTWRLYRIFVYFKNPGHFLKDYSLTVIVLGCVLTNVLIALLWALLDPIEAGESGRPIDLVKIIRNSNQSVQSVEIQRNITLACGAQNQTFYLWFVSLHSFYFLLVILLIILVLLTRNIPQEQFKTKHLLHWDCASCFLGLLVMVVYMLLLPLSGPQAILIRFIFFNAGLNILVLGMCAFLFIPLFHSVYSRRRICSCLKSL